MTRFASLPSSPARLFSLRSATIERAWDSSISTYGFREVFSHSGRQLILLNLVAFSSPLHCGCVCSVSCSVSSTPILLPFPSRDYWGEGGGRRGEEGANEEGGGGLGDSPDASFEAGLTSPVAPEPSPSSVFISAAVSSSRSSWPTLGTVAGSNSCARSGSTGTHTRPDCQLFPLSPQSA